MMNTIEICERMCALTEEIRIARAQGITFIPEATAAMIGRNRWGYDDELARGHFQDHSGSRNTGINGKDKR